MRERLPWLERIENSLRGVLEAAAKTKTLVFNEAKRLAGDPNFLIGLGTTVLSGGLLGGVASSIAVVYPYSHIPSSELPNFVTTYAGGFYAGFLTGASVVLGVGLIRRGIERRRTNLAEFNILQNL